MPSSIQAISFGAYEVMVVDRNPVFILQQPILPFDPPCFGGFLQLPNS